MNPETTSPVTAAAVTATPAAAPSAPTAAPAPVSSAPVGQPAAQPRKGHFARKQKKNAPAVS